MASPSEGPRTPLGLHRRLSAMMFLQYFVQGCYLPVASDYLKEHLQFTASELGIFGAAVAFGALLAPFISGQLADRYFRTERFLAFSHLLGGILMLLIARQGEPLPLLTLAFVYSLLYVPTISLTNTLSFRHLHNVETEFPRLRMWGTIGFILAQWPFEFLWLTPLKEDPAALAAARGDGFILSGLAGLLMAGYCLTLPSTPPPREARTKFAPRQAFRLLPNRAFLVLFLVSLPIAIVHKYHFVWNPPFLRAGGVAPDWIGRVSSVGQIFEIVVMVVLGVMVVRLGFKWTLIVGILAYVLRNLIFATMPPVAVLVSAQALHGFCFACFFAVAFMFVDRLAPKDARASVQTFFNIFALGVGAFLGGWFAGQVGELFTDDTSGLINYTGLWLVPAGVALAALLVFLIAFPNRPLEGRSSTSDVR